MAAGPPSMLQRIAALLIRGPDARFILADLEGSFEREVARGLSLHSARWRYGMNVLGSVLSVWRARIRMPHFGPSWLDVKLGVRMLRKQPGLTLAAMFALAIGIPASLMPLHFANALHPTLPFNEGERIVGLRNWDVAENRPVRRSLHDFVVWRDALSSFEAIGVARRDVYNVISEDGRAAPIQGAKITASAFGLLRVNPLRGRTLLAADEVMGAPDVVIIGYDLWQSRLAGDPEVIGSVIRIRSVPHEVVGVMPEGFLFPFHEHLWLPLRANPVDYERGQGPDVLTFARLADGVSMEEANLELSTVGLRMASEYPDTHARLRPEILPYPLLFMRVAFEDTPLFYWVQLMAVLLLTVTCGSVSILILARTAMRSGEVAVRTALGASRARIVAQMFVEALVLAVLSAGLGLLFADWIAGKITTLPGIPQFTPFWLDLGVTGKTTMWALAFAVFSAGVVGVVPALKATGVGVQRNLQRASAGPSGIRFGGGSTVLIVAEVALAVSLLSVGGAFVRTVLRDASEGMTIPTNEYLSAELVVPRAAPAGGGEAAYSAEFAQQVRETQQELARRLAAEPGVRGVAMGNTLPGMDHSQRPVEVEGRVQASEFRGHWVFNASVDIDFFSGFRQPILSGRGFNRTDLQDELADSQATVIVNTSFVEQVLFGANPLGTRVRYLARDGGEPGPWYEVIGVVGHLGMNELNPARDMGLYHPVAPGDLQVARYAIHVGDDPTSFIPRLREIASEVDPTATIQGLGPLDEVYNRTRTMTQWGLFALGLVAAIAIVLSAAGLYALMSFTVSERTREIGIRTALGGQPRRIVSTIARRSLAQLALGVLVGVALGTLVLASIDADFIVMPGHWLLVTEVAGLMVLIGMLACVQPVLRALRIRPMEALRDG